MTPRAAQVRFYVDADVLGLGKVLAGLRNDVTYPGDPGAPELGRGRRALAGFSACEPGEQGPHLLRSVRLLSQGMATGTLPDTGQPCWPTVPGHRRKWT